MRYKIIKSAMDPDWSGVVIDHGGEAFTSFPAEVGNPVYDGFLQSQDLTDPAVQAMTPDEWHDIA